MICKLSLDAWMKRNKGLSCCCVCFEKPRLCWKSFRLDFVKEVVVKLLTVGGLKVNTWKLVL